MNRRISSFLTFGWRDLAALLASLSLLAACGGGAAGADAQTTSSAATLYGLQSALAVRASSTTPAAQSGTDLAVRYVRLEAVSEINGNPWASMAEFNLLDTNGTVIPRDGWSASADSAEMVGEIAPAQRAIDGDPNTFWHTQWYGANPPGPHTFTVDLGTARVIGGFKYLPRPGAGNGTIAAWRFSTSIDGSNWTLAAQGSFAKTADEKTVLIGSAPAPAPAPTGTVQYVRLEAVSEVNGNPWASMAEFNLLDTSGAVIPRDGWSASADSAEMVGEIAPAQRAIDGDPNTFWHTQWYGASPPGPHTFTVKLGTARAIGGFKYLPRPGGGNGTIAAWRFYTSVDGSTWTLAAEGSFAAGADEKTVLIGAAPPPAPLPTVPTGPIGPIGQNPPVVLNA
ncbi:MAG: discoidin domain-containing protein, partial [Burkholderiales bacterium]